MPLFLPISFLEIPFILTDDVQYYVRKVNGIMIKFSACVQLKVNAFCSYET